MEKNKMAKEWEDVKAGISDLLADEQRLNELATRLGKTVEEIRATEKDMRFLVDIVAAQNTVERTFSPNGFSGTSESRSKALKIALWLSKLPTDKEVAEYSSIFEKEEDRLAILELLKNGVITEIDYDLMVLDPKKPFELPERLFTISNKQRAFDWKRKLAELRPGIQAEEYWKEYRLKFDATRVKLFVDECVRNWLDGKTFRPYAKPLAQTDWQIRTLRNALRERHEKFGDQLIEVSESEKWATEIDLAPALAYLDSTGEVSIDTSAYGTTVTFSGPTRFPLRTLKVMDDACEKIRISEVTLAKGKLTLGGKEIKLGPLQAVVMDALLDCEIGEWLDFDEIAEHSQDDRDYDDGREYENEMHQKRNLQYYGASRRLNEKIYAKIGIKDFLENTSKTVRIRPDKATD